MMNFQLPEDQLERLRSAHPLERCKQAAYKLNAFILLHSEWALSQIHEALLLDEEALRLYVEKFKPSGINELVQTNHMAQLNQLNQAQIQQLCEELEKKNILDDKCGRSITCKGAFRYATTHTQWLLTDGSTKGSSDSCGPTTVGSD